MFNKVTICISGGRFEEINQKRKEKKKGDNHKSAKRELLTAPRLEGARGGKRKYWILLGVRHNWEPPEEIQPQKFVSMARMAGGSRTEVIRNITTLSYTLISCNIYQWPSPTRSWKARDHG